LFLNTCTLFGAVIRACGQLDEVKAKELIAECDNLRQSAMNYVMVSSQSGTETEFGDASPDIEFQAKSS